MSVSLCYSFKFLYHFSSVEFSRSVMSDSLSPHRLQHARPVHHKLPEFTQTHVHWVSDATQPSRPLSSPFPHALNFPQHQVAKVLELQLQHLGLLLFPKFQAALVSNSLSGSGLVAQSCSTLETPWTLARQAPLSMGFPRQEYWSGLSFPSPGNLSDPGIEPM